MKSYNVVVSNPKFSYMENEKHIIAVKKMFFFPLSASALPDDRSFSSNGFMTNFNFGSNQQLRMPTLLGSPTSSGSSSFGSPPAATTAFSRLPQQPTNRFYHQNNRTSSK